MRRQQQISFQSACWGVAGAGLVFLLGSPSDASLYMHREHDFLAYVRINDLAGNRRGSNVRGEFQFVVEDDRAENGFTVKRANISGSQSGNSLLLETDGFFGLDAKQLYGTLGGGKLSLNFPVDSGRIEKLVFVAATEEHWNRALAAFTHRRAAEVAERRRQQARAAEIQERQGRLQAARTDEAQAEQDLAELKKQTPADDRERDQAQEKLATVRRRLDRVNELRRIAGERLNTANSVAAKAGELARQSGSARSLEAVKHAQRVVEAVAAQVREVAGEIQREASGASRGEPSADADLHEAQQTLDAAMAQLEREETELGAAHGRPDEGMQNQSESGAEDTRFAARDVEFAAHDVEFAAHDVEFAASGIESAVSDVESQVADAQSGVTEAEAKAAQDRRASADLRARVTADQRQAQACAQQLESFAPAPVVPALDQYTGAIQYYNRRLSRLTARRLAAALLGAGSQRAVDVRLLLSILVTEGALEQLQTGKGNIGSCPMQAAVSALAEDVQRRLKPTVGAHAKHPTGEPLVQALTARFKSRRGANSEAAKRYAQRVIRLYAQMCAPEQFDN